jgi:hypothetical protein
MTTLTKKKKYYYIRKKKKPVIARYKKHPNENISLPYEKFPSFRISGAV